MSGSHAAASRVGRVEALLAIVLGCVATFAVFGSGWASADTLHQYLQVSGRMRLDDAHPPLMVLLWRVTDALWSGSAGLHALFVLAWWSGLVGVVWQAFATRWQRWLVVLAVGFWPPAFLMLGHVWKDVGMAAALLVGVATILRVRERGGRGAFVAALLALLVACAFRHNAIAAAWPLLVWLCWPRDAARSRVRSGLLVLIATTALLLVPPAVARLAGAVRGDAWTLVALWDIGAVSVAQDRVLLPASIHLPDLGVDDLRAGYLTWANPPLFGSGKIVLSLYVPYSDAQLADVRQAWWHAVSTWPGDYLAHRAALARHLLTGYDAALPYQLVFVPERLVVDAGEPRLEARAPDDPAVSLAHRLRTTPLFAGALYLALAAIACIGALRASRRRVRATVCVLAFSATTNLLALFVVAGSAEFRYLLWSVLASLLACAIAWLPSRGGDASAISAASPASR